MRASLIAFFLLFIFTTNAQDQIFKKDGSVVTPEPGSLKFEISNRTFYYNLPNVKKQQKITYKDISYVLFNDLKLKPVKLKKGRFGGYFVLAETDKYNLYTMAIESPYHYYEVIVTDKQENILEYNDFMDNNMARHNNDRKAAGASIEKYFSDCTELMNRIGYMREQNTGAKEVKMSWWVRDLVVQSTYIDCTN